jgi:hypothetical protein
MLVLETNDREMAALGSILRAKDFVVGMVLAEVLQGIRDSKGVSTIG